MGRPGSGVSGEANESKRINPDDPVAISGLRTKIVVLEAHDIAHLIEQLFPCQAAGQLLHQNAWIRFLRFPCTLGKPGLGRIFPQKKAGFSGLLLVRRRTDP